MIKSSGSNIYCEDAYLGKLIEFVIGQEAEPLSRNYPSPFMNMNNIVTITFTWTEKEKLIFNVLRKMLNPVSINFWVTKKIQYIIDISDFRIEEIFDKFSKTLITVKMTIYNPGVRIIDHATSSCQSY